MTLAKSKMQLFVTTINGFQTLTIKDKVMRTEKALINDRLPVSKVSWKFRIPAMYNFTVVYPWNLLLS